MFIMVRAMHAFNLIILSQHSSKYSREVKHGVWFQTVIETNCDQWSKEAAFFVQLDFLPVVDCVVCGVLTRSLIVFCSGLQFSDNVLGKALVNTICTFSSSGGVSSDSVLICYAQFQLFVLHNFFLFKIPQRFQMAWSSNPTPWWKLLCLYVQSSSFYFM